MTSELSWVSLWWDGLPPELSRPLGEPLQSDTSVDIAIVGAGFTGLWTAYYLQQLDPALRIAIVESRRAGFGASGRNGGWASDLFPVDLPTVARSSSRDEAVRLKRTMQDSIDEMAAVIGREGWDVGWKKGGSVTFARTPLQLKKVTQDVSQMHSWGFSDQDYRLLSRTEAQSVAQATDVLGASFTPHCAAVDPARLVRHLAATVVRHGARLYEMSPVTSIEPGLVRTADASVRAPVIVRATEGYTGALQGRKREILPLYSLMIATEPLPPEVWHQIGLDSRSTFTDARNLIIYGQRTSDGRFAFGGRGAPYHFRSSVNDAYDRDPRVHEALWRELTNLFPAVSGAAVTHTWGGPLAVTRDWWASCGYDPRTGLAWSGGYAGDGVTTSNLGGRTLADLITATRSDLITLPWVEHRSRPWEPEPLRWIAVNGARQLVTYADTVEDRTGRTSRLGRAVRGLVGH